MIDRKALIKAELERVDGALGGGKHRKMARDPFVFMRGSAQLFYHDLASGRLLLPAAIAQLPLTTVMGDCHLSNFGFFTEEGSHGDQVIFAPNDFDDACIGRAAWDLVRFCASLRLCQLHCETLAGNSNGDSPKNPDDLARSDAGVIAGSDSSGSPVVTADAVAVAVEACLTDYWAACQASAASFEYRQQAPAPFGEDHFLYRSYRKAQARAAGGSDFLRKSSLAKQVDLQRRPLAFLQRSDKLRPVSAALYAEIEFQFAPYVDDKILDIAERVNAGTGSVNLTRYYLLVGPTTDPTEIDLALCHIIEIKQQRPAAALHFFPDLSPVNRLNSAHLTVYCQRRMERRPDWALDEVVWRDAHWLARSRHHARVCLDPEDVGLGEAAVNGGFVAYARACGQALALAHCRGDRRSLRFETAVCQRLPPARAALAEAAEQYAQTAVADCLLLRELLREHGAEVIG